MVHALAGVMPKLASFPLFRFSILVPGGGGEVRVLQGMLIFRRGNVLHDSWGIRQEKFHFAIDPNNFPCPYSRTIERRTIEKILVSLSHVVLR